MASKELLIYFPEISSNLCYLIKSRSLWTLCCLCTVCTVRFSCAREFTRHQRYFLNCRDRFASKEYLIVLWQPSMYTYICMCICGVRFMDENNYPKLDWSSFLILSFVLLLTILPRLQPCLKAKKASPLTWITLPSIFSLQRLFLLRNFSDSLV